jgi:Sec-independent protein secretion pathway component TatC
MTHVQAALFIHGYTAVMVSLGFGLPKMEPTLAFFVLLGCAFTLPVIIIAMERVQVLSRAIRRKENAKTH